MHKDHNISKETYEQSLERKIIMHMQNLYNIKCQDKVISGMHVHKNGLFDFLCYEFIHTCNNRFRKKCI